MSLAKLNRGKKEVEEVQAEVIVDYCVRFLEHAHKLWKESLPEEKFRLQSLIFPEGISYDALTGKQTPKMSPVYEAISELQNGNNTLAARRSVITNTVLHELIDWYKVLRDLPVMQEVGSEMAFTYANG